MCRKKKKGKKETRKENAIILRSLFFTFKFSFQIKYFVLYFEVLPETPSDLFAVTEELQQEDQKSEAHKRIEGKKERERERETCFHLPLQPFPRTPAHVTLASSCTSRCNFHSAIRVVTTKLCSFLPVGKTRDAARGETAGHTFSAYKLRAEK